MAQRIELPCIVPERAAKGRKDTHILYDGTADLAERLKRQYRGTWGEFWGAGMTQAEAETAIAEGDLAGVAASDKHLSRLEDLYHIDARSFSVVPDVAGSLPNVPAYLAGQPLSMRRRARVEREAAPLTVTVDLSSSASIGPDVIRKRGAAILALVRILATRRPVTLWVGAAIGNAERQKDYNASWVRMETSPMDLARCAHMLTHPSVSRGILYGTTTADCGGSQTSIPWAYGDASLERKTSHANLSRIFAANGETLLYIPPIHRNDQWSAPEQWLYNMVAKHGHAEAMDEAA